MDEPTAVAGPSPSRGNLLAIRVLSLLAAGVAAYLFFVSLSERGLPIGCGQGSGCGEVLRSRWVSVLGVPVGEFAFVAYLAAFISTFVVPLPNGRGAWRLLVVIAACVLLSALWFVGLQLFVLRAVCPWCMADHALGVAMAIAIFWGARASSPPVRMATPTVLGVVLTSLLVAAQVFLGGGASVARLPAGQNADSGVGDGRQIAVLNGKLTLAVDELPMLGSPDAPQLVALLYDYCCPHCRATHGYLLNEMPKYGGQFGVVLLPMPLDASCNPSVDETEPRFRESCELTRLALAVWRAKPIAFAEFDAWLYEPEMPRALQDARKKAVELIGESELAEALADPWIDARIAADVAGYDASGAKTLPVLAAPKMDTVVGRPESAEELFGILERELALQPAAP